MTSIYSHGAVSIRIIHSMIYGTCISLACLVPSAIAQRGQQQLVAARFHAREVASCGQLSMDGRNADDAATSSIAADTALLS